MKTELTEIIAAYNPNNSAYIHEDDVVSIAEDFAAQFKQEWVDVKQLNTDSDVLLLFENGFQDIGHYSKFTNRYICHTGIHDENDGSTSNKVIHWQPLPSHLKKKDNENNLYI